MSDTSSSGDGGEPIDIATANVSEQVTDYTTAGQNRLDFTRYYNSMAPANATTGGLAVSPVFASSLGISWRSTYDRYLDVSSASVAGERVNAFCRCHDHFAASRHRVVNRPGSVYCR